MSILNSTELLLQASNYSGSGAWLDEANSHDAQFGSTSGDDTNDPLFKAFTGTQYILLPTQGTTNNYLSSPDAAALDITGDIDLRVKLAAFDWTTGEFVFPLSKWIEPQQSWAFGFNATDNDRLYLAWSTDGSNALSAESSVNFPHADGALVWVRVTFDVDNGASDAEIKFYTSTDDAITWDQLGTTQLAGSTTSIFSGTGTINIGGHTNGTSVFVADYHRAQIYDGIDGTLVFDADLRFATEPFATFTEQSSEGATVTINRATSGQMSTVIDRPQMLYTTDDYHEIPDDAALDFLADEDLSTMVVFRTNTVASGEDVLLSKKDNLTTSTGYALLRSTANGKGLIADGTADDDDTAATVAIHTLHSVAMVRNIAGDDVETFLDGVGSGSETPDSTTSTLANALVMRIGATSNTAANFFEGQIIAVAQWPADTALTDAQVLEAHTRLTQLPAYPPFPRRQNTLVRM